MSPVGARYDPRQLHCLKALGLVPWVLRTHSAPRVHPEPAALPESAATSGIRSAAPVAGFQFPDDQSELARCLSGFAVSVMPRRGSSASESALKGRVILLLESRHITASSQPIDGYVWDLDKQEEQLLVAMLRSIGLVENDLCRTVPAVLHEVHEDTDQPVTVAELHRQVPRLALLLLNRFDASLSPAHHRLDGGAGIMGWRLPHPAVLLENPELKRQAWEVLKVIRPIFSS